MIARGEVLERMTLVRAAGAEGLELEGLFQDGASSVRRALPVVLAAPHPRLGGNMDSPVLAELVWALARAGHPTLRFNWRGIGASQGVCRVPWLPAAEPVPLEDEVADLSAAVDQQVAQLGEQRCALVGYSFGAIIAARVARHTPAVEHLVLVAPPIRVLPLLTAELGEELDAGLDVGMSITVVAAELDEHAPLDELRAVVGRVSIHVVPAATHTFLRGLSQVGTVVQGCLPGAGLEPPSGIVSARWTP